MATATRYPVRPLSSRAVFRDTTSRSGIHALPKVTPTFGAPPPNVIIFPASMPSETRQKAASFIKTAADRLSEQSVAYTKAASERRDLYKHAYPYIELLALGPVQFVKPDSEPAPERLQAGAAAEPENDPFPYRPSTSLRPGEWTMVCCLEWNNPTTGPGGSLPGTVVLGNRPWRIQFEAINRTQMTAGGKKIVSGVFARVAPDVIVRAWFFKAPDPGDTPALYEANVTFTVGIGERQLTRFAAWQPDPSAEAPFLNLSKVPGAPLPQSMRYLVLPKQNPAPKLRVL